VHQELNYQHLHLHLHPHDEKMRRIRHILNKNLNDLKNKRCCIFKINLMFCYLFVSFIEIRKERYSYSRGSLSQFWKIINIILHSYLRLFFFLIDSSWSKIFIFNLISSREKETILKWLFFIVEAVANHSKRIKSINI